MRLTVPSVLSKFVLAEINESEDHYETHSQNNIAEGKPHYTQAGLRQSSTWFSGIFCVCESALTAVFKGWVRQEITTQAIPVVSSLVAIVPCCKEEGHS